MRWSDRTATTAAALTLIVVAGWLIGRSPRAERSAERIEAERSVHEAPIDPIFGAGATPAPERAGPRVDPGRRDPAGDPDNTSRAPVENRPGVLRGRVVSDELGAPLAGASVEVARRPLGEFRIPGSEALRSLTPIASTLSDEDGRFALSVPAAVPLRLDVRAADHAAARREHLFGGDDITVRLARAARLEGTLTRSDDGAPLEGSLVVGRNEDRIEVCRSRADIGGRFQFDDLAPGLLTVEITPVGAATPPSQRVDLRAGQRSRLDLSLDRGSRVHGVVLGEDRMPIAGAEVGLGATYQCAVRTDVHGRYELLGLGGVERRDLTGIRARAPGHGRETVPLRLDPSATDVRIDFELRAGRVAVGRVVDRDNAPIEGVYVAASGSSSANGAPRSDWETARTGPDGRFVLDTLHPEIAHQIFLQRDGYGTRVYDFPVGERAEDRVDLGTFVLHSGGRIEGTLVGRDGSPVRGHLVKLRGANGDLDRLRPDADPIEKTWVTAVRESRTDTRGRFHFDGLPGGTLRATASVRGRPDARAEAVVELAEGDRVDGVQLRLDLGGVISGRVERPDGAPAPGVFVQVAGPVGGPRIRARSGSGGRFELLGLDDDQGEVELFTIVASYNWYHPDAPLGAGPRTLARPGDAGLVLVLSGLTALSGHVEFPGGDLALDATVTAYPSGAARTKAAALARATCDRGGSFELDLPENCRVDLVVEAPASATDANDGGSDSTSPRTVLEGIASDARGLRIQLVR